MVTATQLARIASRAAADVVRQWHAALVPEMAAADITTAARQAAFLASVMNETGGLLAFDEASYFSTPWSRIKQIFGGVRGLTPELVEGWKQGGRKAFDVAFFNHVYADSNRGPGYGLGNTQPGDGYRYRGMGPGALTGRGNFTWMARETGLPLVEDPEMIKRPDVGAKLAAHFWVKNGCNAAVSDGSQAGFLWAMQKLNAGLHDFTPHLNWWERCKQALAEELLGDMPAATAPAARQADVRATQAALVARGYDTGGIDGITGPKTRAALAAFEADNHLPQDGVVDDEVLRLLGLAPPPAGYQRTAEGNVVRTDVEQSAIIKESNKGMTVGGVAAAAGAASPLLTSVAGMRWELAAVLAVVVLGLAGLALVYFTRIKNARRKMNADGIA